MFKLSLTALLTSLSLLTFGQNTAKTIAAVRTNSHIVVDGELNDTAWRSAPIATSFIEARPSFGKVEDEKNKTEIRILYNDEAIYVSGFCHEASRDSISTDLVGRDEIGVNDFVGVLFDTYHDKINGFGYFITPLGEQYDAKYSLGNEDASWNSVYETATKITNDGWMFEMRIPYSAIRFSKDKVQNWGINFIRKRNKSGKQLFWNGVDPNKFGLMTQAATWTNIENIKPPLRLSFSPYFSTYVNHDGAGVDGKKWSRSVNGGMDLKFGISKAFTLDMTLVPDFGQVQSDNLVLNLTPFEVKYNENRSFFTEGTELFNKGNLFYSRRIGGQPIHLYDVQSNLKAGETIVKNPSETKLMNATKISGRTSSGLGIGVFNAVTRSEYAIVQDDKNNEYKVETSPLTNYNVFVLDQTLKHNSSISFVNTSVMRSGKDYDANVSAFLWDLYDKNVKWNFWGKLGTSQLFGYAAPGKTYSGYQYNLNFGKFKGPFNFEVHRNFVDDKYQQNDMGYFTNNNYITHGFWMGYKWTKPRWIYNNVYLNFNGNFTQRYLPREYQSIIFNGNINGQLKNLWNYGITSDINPSQHDFYEPRKAGKMFRTQGSWMQGFWLNTNSAKKYSAGVEYYHRTSPTYKMRGTQASLNNQFRFNKKLSVGLTNFLSVMNNNAGFAFKKNNTDSIFFGLRDRKTIENVFSVKYNFTNKMGINVRARHYLSKVKYTSFFALKDDGNLSPVNNVSQNVDNNVNYFNVDMMFTWQFAQGSFINVSYKNAADLYDREVERPYFKNLKNTLKAYPENSFSVKVIYYLDYLQLKKKRA